ALRVRAETRGRALLLRGPPVRGRRGGVAPSSAPPMTVLVGASGSGTVVLTAKPEWVNARPARRLTWTAADALLTTDTTYCDEFESMLRLRWVSIGRMVVPSGCSCETTRLKSESGLRTVVVSTASPRSVSPG